MREERRGRRVGLFLFLGSTFRIRNPTDDERLCKSDRRPRGQLLPWRIKICGHDKQARSRSLSSSARHMHRESHLQSDLQAT